MDQQQVVINLADVASDAEALGKLYELGSIMIQSNCSEEVKTGYEILELVDRELRRTDPPLASHALHGRSSELPNDSTD